MKKYMKFIPFIIIPIIMIILVIAILLKKNGADKVLEYPVNSISGNLNNGGFYIETDNQIYFSNNQDQDTLYSMDLNCVNFKKISNDSVAYLNATNKHIYYVRQNYKKDSSTGSFGSFNTTGVFRVNFNGSDTESYTSDISGIININGNNVYFEHYDEESGLQLYKSNLNEKVIEKLTDESISPSSIYNNNLYYASKLDGNSIKKIDLNTMYSETILDGQYYMPLVVDNYIYYISVSDNYAIGRCNLDGSNPTLLVNDRTCTFNVSLSGKYLYYQVDDGKNNRLCVMNLTTKETKDIINGNFNYINMTSSYVFFRDIQTNVDYVINVGENAKLGIFEPPVIKE